MPTPLTAEQLDYRSYLLDEFPAALAEVAASIPPDRRQSPQRDGGLAIHIGRLGFLNQVIRRMEPHELTYFAVGMHWCEVLDLEVRLRHPEAYARFREFTRFPKLIVERDDGSLVTAAPPTALRRVGGRRGDFILDGGVRRAVMREYAPAVVDIVDRLAGMQEQPFLREMFRSVLHRHGIRTEGAGQLAVDPLPRDAFDSWLMPSAWDDDFGDLLTSDRPRRRRPAPESDRDGSADGESR